MIKILRAIFILAIIFVALLILKGLVDNLAYLKKKNEVRYFLDNQFSKLKLEDLPKLSLPDSKENILVSNGIYITRGNKSGEGIKDWRKIEYWIREDKDFSYLDIDLVSFYTPSQAQAFYQSEKETRILQLPHQVFRQKEEGSFAYYISQPKPERISLEGLSPNYPGHASFVIILKGNLFIGINELASFEKSNYKLSVLKKITSSK